MEEHGRVIVIMPIRQGVSQRTGQPWASQDFVIEVDGRYSRKVRLSLWGADRIQAANLQLGEYVTARFDIEAHETNGEYYNDLRCWDIVKNGVSVLRSQPAPIQQAPPVQQTQAPQYAPQPMNNQVNTYSQGNQPLTPQQQFDQNYQRIFGQPQK